MIYLSLGESPSRQHQRPNSWRIAVAGSLLLGVSAATPGSPEGFQDTVLAQPSAAPVAVAMQDAASPPVGDGALHQLFDGVLQDYVADGRVDYPAIAEDDRFAAYLRWLQSNPADNASREQELAYWINAYNALAIKGIIDGKSPSSFFGRVGYFKTTKYEVGGKRINLYDLEREVLIPFGEPRIHFAIVCASASCPQLRSEAYTAAKLGQQLEDGATQFINHSTRNRFDRENKTAYLSMIFSWFDSDFEQHSGSVQRYVARYVDDPAVAAELAANRYTIEHLKYDWSLNGVSPRR